MHYPPSTIQKSLSRIYSTSSNIQHLLPVPPPSTIPIPTFILFFQSSVPCLLTNSSSILFVQSSTILIVVSPLPTSLIYFSSLPFPSAILPSQSSTIQNSLSRIYSPSSTIHHLLSVPPPSAIPIPSSIFFFQSFVPYLLANSSSILFVQSSTILIIVSPLPTSIYFSSLPFPSTILPSQSSTIQYPTSTIEYRLFNSHSPISTIRHPPSSFYSPLCLLLTPLYCLLSHFNITDTVVTIFSMNLSISFS